MSRLLSFAAVAAALVLSTAAPSFADRYDTPIINVVDASRASITLEVTAGATGLPAGFSIDWMTQQAFLLGGWNGAGNYYCTLNGTPTWNTWPGATTYRLGPYETARIEIGDMFDETGIATDYNVELDFGVNYVFRGYADGDANGEASYYTSTILASTLGGVGCTFTQGYWKNHTEDWPVFATMTLGTVNYTPAQLLSILNTPAAGNGILILAHQLITAKLNGLNGADLTPVAGAIATADGLIGGLVIPPVGAGFLAPGTVSATATTLDNYNNGKTTVPHCGETPATQSTWGTLKSRYRN